MNSIVETARRAATALLMFDEEELRRLLCLWVSGEEPVILMAPDGTIVGLTRRHDAPWLSRPPVDMPSSDEYRRMRHEITRLT